MGWQCNLLLWGPGRTSTSSPWAFSQVKWGIIGTSTVGREVLSLITFYYRLDGWKSFFIYRLLIYSGKRFWGICLNFGGICTVDFTNISWRFAHKEEQSNWSVSPDSAIMLTETQQIKYVKGSFNLPSWQFWLLLSNSRIISPFGRIIFQHDIFLRILAQ